MSKIAGLCFVLLMTNACVGAAAAKAPAESATLRQARQRLALAEATAARIARERIVLKNRTTLAPAVAADLEVYQTSVEKMVAVQRRHVAALEVATAKPHKPDGKHVPKIKDLPDHFDEPKSREAELNDEFADSLSAFDEFLLVEIEEADKAASGGSDSAEMTELARQAAEAAQRLKERGIDVAGEGQKGGEGQKEEETADGGNGEAGEAGDPVADGGEAGSPVDGGESGAPVSGGPSPPGNGGAPPGTPPPGDDDIVARQLREAAEREKDPVLREKLWREYRAYKEGNK